MKAIIMAGGEGTRLRPLTCDRPKPMVPVANRPIMAYAIELLKAHEIKDIGVTLQYLPEVIKEHFGSGEEYHVNLHYFLEDEPLGTAGSVKNAEGFLDDTFIVISGDALTDFNLSRAISFHREKGSLGTLILTTVDNPLQYGVVITESDGRIRSFLEKPGWGEVFSDRVNTGIYILEPEVLQYIPLGKLFDFSKDLFPFLMESKKPLFGCTLEGYWCDIGNLDQYLQAHYDLLDGKVNTQLTGKAVDKKGTVIAGEGTLIHENAQIRGPVVLGKECRISAGAKLEPYTVVGDRVRIEEGASVKRSVIWNGAYIGKNSSVRGAVLCESTSLHERASIYEGAVLGDGGMLMENALIRPGVKIWPYKTVEAGVPLSESLVWGTRCGKALFGSEGVGGRANVDITPEFCTRMGLAYGTSLPRSKKVAVSCDGSEICSTLKDAFASGVRGTGIQVCDLGGIFAPVHRYAVAGLKAEGGVHIKRDAGDRDRVWIVFTNYQGNDLKPEKTRKIENLYWLENFRRASSTEVLSVIHLREILKEYIQDILEAVDKNLVKQRVFQIVLYCQSPVLSTMLSFILEERLGCLVRVYNPGADGKDFQSWSQMQEMVSFLAREVVATGADLAAVVDLNAENIMFIDNEGVFLDANMFTALVSLIILKSNKGGVISVSVTAPGVVEKLADRYDGRVIRTKASRHAIMESGSGEEVRERQGIYSQVKFQYDAFFAIVRLLDFLSKKGLSLSQLVNEIPDFYISQKYEVCPWEYKGKVMRNLIETETAQNVELIDGIKVHSENGWVLALPHCEKPVYQILSEGVSQEAAEELTGFYASKIKKLINQN